MKTTTSGAVDLMAALLASLERAKAARDSSGSHAHDAEPESPVGGSVQILADAD